MIPWFEDLKTAEGYHCGWAGRGLRAQTWISSAWNLVAWHKNRVDVYRPFLGSGYWGIFLQKKVMNHPFRAGNFNKFSSSEVKVRCLYCQF